MIKWFRNRSPISLAPEEEELKQNYISLFSKKISKHTPIEELNFIILDTETSGLNIKKDSLLSLAAIKLIQNEIFIKDRLEFYIKNNDYDPNQSIEVHGITKTQSQAGEPIREVIKEFISYIGNGILVGHHVSFDVNMLDKYVHEFLGIHLRNKTIDTAILNHRLEHSVNSTARPISLDDMATKYNIPLGERHTAAGDTFITAMLFLKLLNRLKKRGVYTYGELVK